MKAMTLTTDNGIPFNVEIAGPEDARAAVMILHDWWGVLDYNRNWAERLAEAGYRVMIVDLYDGENATDAQEAGEMMRNLDQEVADRKLMTALAWLKAGSPRVAVLGWSLGGHQALQAAILDPETVDAAVLFYCRLINDLESLRTLNGPVLAVFAEQERTWPEKMERFGALMSEAGKPLEVKSYAAGHGFVNPRSARFDAAAAEDGWQVTLDFLHRALA